MSDQIGPDGLTDRQRAALGATRNSLGVSNAPPPPARVQAPAAVAAPAPMPQQQGITSGIIGILKGRQQQIDKASGYRNGGKIQGPGTPTSDSIPATVRETGEGIAVSTKERILSADQDALLEAMARKSGFDSLDSMLEAGTGKPVGPTIKGGKRAAAGGISFFDDFSEAAKRDTPLAGIIKPFQAAQKLMPDVPEADSQAYARQSQPAVNHPEAAQTPPTLGTGLNGMTQPSHDAGFMTGAKPGEMPSSAQGGFTQGGKSYNVNPSGQEGIARVTAPGTSPLYTNINPEQAVSGLKNQMIGGDAASVNEGLARHANANAIRQSMIDAQPTGGIAIMPDAPNPASQGLSIGDIQSAMKSSGTRTERAAYGHMLNTALNNQVQSRGQDLNYAATTAGQGITARGQDMNNARAMGHDQVIMRGQDINAQTDAKRLGIVQTAEERAADRWNVERPGIVAQAKDADAVRSARQGLMDAVASGDPKAIEKARTTAIAAGIKLDKPADNFDFKTGPMGNVAVQQLPDGGASITTFGIDGKPHPAVTIPAPGARQTAQAPADALAYLKQNPNQAAAFKSKYGYLPEGF